MTRRVSGAPPQLAERRLGPLAGHVPPGFTLRRTSSLPCIRQGGLLSFAACPDLRDQPGAALACEVDPQPRKCHGEPAFEPDQKVDVRDTPDPPGKPPLQA